MARKKRSSKLRPKSPSRVRRRKKKATRTRSHHYPELIGLALVAFGVFLAAVLYGSWSAGVVGGRLADGLESLVGAAVYVLPVAAICVGALALVRSELVDMRPFRIGLVVTSAGLLLMLGDAHGGYAGEALEAAFAWLIGSTGVLILGTFTLLAGLLLLTGASVGAIVRRSHGAVQTVRRRAAARAEGTPLAEVIPLEPARNPPPPLVDGVHDYPDLTEQTLEPAPLLMEPEEPREDTQPSLFDPSEIAGEPYRLPDRTLLRRSTSTGGASAETSARVAETLVTALANFGIDANVVGEISGPRVTRYELQLAPGTKVAKVAGAEGRPLVRARDDGDPHPRADPRQAGRGRRGAQPLPEARHARRHLRRPAATREPTLGLAGQGHLRQRRLDRPRAHAAPPHRRHDRLRQVGLHQHDPHLDAAARHAGRGADDPRSTRSGSSSGTTSRSRTC